MEKQKIDELMRKRGFYFDKEMKNENPQVKSYIYIKENDVEMYNEYVILVEIYDDCTWHLFYHQPKMVGFMDSGLHGKIEDEFGFRKVYEAFNKQVRVLRNGLR